MLFRNAVPDPRGYGFLVVEQGKYRDNAIWRYTPEEGMWQQISFPERGHYQGVCVSPDGGTAYLNAGEKVVAVSLADGEKLWELPLDVRHHWIALSKDGRRLFLTFMTQDAGQVTLIDVARRAVTGTIELEHPVSRIEWVGESP
jgi:hypothetical protein